MIAPCPWCKQSETCILGAADLHYVHCIFDGCSADGPLRSTEAEAIAAWNEVAEKVARNDALRVPGRAEAYIRREEGVERTWHPEHGFFRCGACHGIQTGHCNVYCPHCGAKVRRPE